MERGRIYFKEWLPDLPALDNPGLTEAKNVIPVEGVYKNFKGGPAGFPVQTTLNSEVRGAYFNMVSYGENTVTYIDYLGDQSRLYVNGSDKSASTYNCTSASWQFSQYENIIFASNGVDLLQQFTVGAAAYSAISAAPMARAMGVVGQFLVLGDLGSTERNYIQWSGIDNPTSFPTPNSSTAIAQQSGKEELPAEHGPVTGISGGDQFGVVFQDRGITRFTYVGGNVVFQFDDIDAGRGCAYRNSIVRVGGVVYFIANDGFYATDGTQVIPIGRNKVDRYFLSSMELNVTGRDAKERVYGALDQGNRCIYWGFPNQSSSGTPNEILIYNYEEKRWARAELTHTALFTFGPVPSPPNSFSPIVYFTTANSWNFFSGPPLDAVIATGEISQPAGDFQRVSGIRPLIQGATANAVTVALGTRNDQQATPTYTSETTANSRTGFADFRSEARYHRARLTITGTFNSAQGIEYMAVPSGAV